MLEAKKSQKDLLRDTEKLKDHIPRKKDRKVFKEKVLENVDKVYKERSKIIEGFREGNFKTKYIVEEPEESEESEEPEESEKSEEFEQSEESEEDKQAKKTKEVNLDWLIYGTEEEIESLKKYIPIEVPKRFKI